MHSLNLGGSRRTHRVFNRGLVVLAAVLAVACGTDRVTDPSRLPATPGLLSFDKHGNWGQRGRLIDARLVREIDHSVVADSIRHAVASSLPNTAAWAASKAALQQSAVEAFSARYDVQQWSITYTTVGTHGELLLVSAGVYMPIGVDRPVPLVSVAHGTLTDKSNVPSNDGIIAQAIGHASHGSVAVFADYIGMGVDATDFPAYLIADINASTSLDALRATRELARRETLSLDGRLFISGYSQGGQVAMALARMIENDPRSGFRVTAAAPASGPYDLYETSRVVLSRSIIYVPSSLYAIYAVAAYQATYNVAERLDQLLTPSASAIGDRLLTTGMTQAEWAPLVPRVARDALQPEVLDAVLNNPQHPLSVALRANQTYDWLPTAPLKMYYAEGDIDVPFAVNATAAADHMRALGATPELVQAVKLVGPNNEVLNHGTGLWLSIVESRKWFDTFPAAAIMPDDDADRAGALGGRMASSP
jgi:hypothetical protein